MELKIGQRLPGYQVTDLVRATPWYRLYAGRKIFANFDFQQQEPREAQESEWLDVYLRTLNYPDPAQAEDVVLRRRLARQEITRVLGHGRSRLWPEPIDLFEVVNDVDALPAELRGSEPILVFARPRGETLLDWQREPVPISSIFSVLAELLHFLHLCHEQGTLLQCLPPEQVLVDRAGRVHCLAGDLALDLKSWQTQGGGSPRWRDLFPDERFPIGFAAPEVFQDPRRLDRRSDLFSWGALAMFLLGGGSPEEIARKQTRPWATWGDEHFAELRSFLTQTPASYVRNWAEELHVSADALQSAWPHGLTALLQRVLSIDPARRPESVPQLRDWLVAPPLDPPEELLAFFKGEGEANLWLRIPTELQPGVNLLIRRSLGKPAATARDGVSIFDNPPRQSIWDRAMPLTTEPIYYTAFLRRGEHYSPPRSACLDSQAPDSASRDRFKRVRKKLVEQVLTRPGDAALWQELDSLAQAQYGVDAPAKILGWICKRLGAAARADLVQAWLAQGEETRLLPSLLARGPRDPHAALVLVALIRFLPAERLPLLFPAVGWKTLTATDRRELLGRFWAGVNPDGAEAVGLLRFYMGHASKKSAFALLNAWEQQVGSGAALRLLRAELQQHQLMHCPRCGISLRRQAMSVHLWDAHRLMLDGNHVRNPWTMIRGWLLTYREKPDLELWERCQDLAHDLDPQAGLAKLQQLWHDL